jgi:hypothetical protein
VGPAEQLKICFRPLSIRRTAVRIKGQITHRRVNDELIATSLTAGAGLAIAQNLTSPQDMVNEVVEPALKRAKHRPE